MLKRILLCAVLLAGSFPPAFVFAAPSDHRPIIGISIDNGDRPGEAATKLGMIQEIEHAGGIPLILNDRADRSADKDIKEIDGLIVQGNYYDIDPARYGQKKEKETLIETDVSRRDYENKIIADALQGKVPMLLICGGMQRANVLLGGTLHQHIPNLPGVKPGHGDNNGNPADVPSVKTEIVPDSKLAKILGKDEVTVNSFHHQALDTIGQGLRVTGYSDAYARPDGSKANLVEAVEADPKGKFAGQFILGLQFHPELMPGSAMSTHIFDAFTHASEKFAEDTQRSHPDEEILRRISSHWQENAAVQ